jgi:hypothetical protein
MSDQQLKDFLYGLLNDLNRQDASAAVLKIQVEIGKLNVKTAAAMMLTKELNYEADGELIWAAPSKKGGR